MRLPDIVYKVFSHLKNNSDIKPTKYPLEIDGGITNLCNLKCKLCPNSKIDREKGFMSMEVFKLMVDCIRDRCESKVVLGLGLWGEPLLHPRLKEFLNYAKQNNVRTKIVSNCVNLTTDISLAIIDGEVVLFEISLYTFNRGNYKELMGKDEFDRVLNNVHNFLTLASNNNFKGMIRLRPLEIYAAEMDRYQKEFYSRYPKLNFERQKPKGVGNWAGFLPLRGLAAKIYVREPCLFCFSRMTIDWDGGVYVCCQAMIAKDLYIGHINKNIDIYDIWHGEKFSEIRSNILKLDYGNLQSCQKCLYSRRYLRIYDIKKIMQLVIKRLGYKSNI